mmetsp:Transcript_88752/g.259380  ORF Transcript_88752/g.259380 Transcript_88752/m.259380 type:complete len:200 (-) Transcript_88752:9-608(-)
MALPTTDAVSVRMVSPMSRQGAYVAQCGKGQDQQTFGMARIFLQSSAWSSVGLLPLGTDRGNCETKSVLLDVRAKSASWKRAAARPFQYIMRALPRLKSEQVNCTSPRDCSTQGFAPSARELALASSESSTSSPVCVGSNLRSAGTRCHGSSRKIERILGSICLLYMDAVQYQFGSGQSLPRGSEERERALRVGRWIPH